MFRTKLAARLAVCQIIGTSAAIGVSAAVGKILNPANAEGLSISLLGIVFAYAVFGLGIPFYCLALFILNVATASILKRPFVWCVVVPGFLFAAALYAFPPQHWRGIFWMALIPMAALIAGSIFYAWLCLSPLSVPNTSN